MHQDFSRNLNILVWQNIDLQNLNQYLDNLKSRIYQGTTQKSYKKIHDAQFKLINSPLVKLIAFKQVLDQGHYTFILNSFQIGYWAFYFNLNMNVTNSVFLLSSNDIVLNDNKEIKLIFSKVKNLIINWSIKPYFDNLYESNSLPCLQYYSDYTDLSFKYESYVYYFSLDLQSLFYYINLSIFMHRMYFLCSIKKYLYEFLDNSVLILLIKSLANCSRSYNLKKDDVGLAHILLNVFILTMCYEIGIICKNSNIYTSYPVIIVNYYSYLLIYCEDLMRLSLWKEVCLDVLIASGVNLRYKKNVQNLLSLKHISSYGRLSNFLNYLPNIAYKPSLYYQYSLIKQVSILLKKSKSKPLFLLVIRLNMLLISWSIVWHTKQAKKIFSLLDYIIYLKLRSLIKKVHIHWSNQQIRLQYFPLRSYSFNSIQAKTSWVLLTQIHCSGLYKIF